MCDAPGTRSDCMGLEDENMTEEECIEIPKSLKIGGYTVKVRFSNHIMTDEEKCGYYNARMRKITIDPEMCKELVYGVFIHEVVEAIKDIYHIECLRDDHHAINQLAEALHQVLRDNPEIMPK